MVKKKFVFLKKKKCFDKLKKKIVGLDIWQNNLFCLSGLVKKKCVSQPAFFFLTFPPNI